MQSVIPKILLLDLVFRELDDGDLAGCVKVAVGAAPLSFCVRVQPGLQAGRGEAVVPGGSTGPAQPKLTGSAVLRKGAAGPTFRDGGDVGAKAKPVGSGIGGGSWRNVF